MFRVLTITHALNVDLQLGYNWVDYEFTIHIIILHIALLSFYVYYYNSMLSIEMFGSINIIFWEENMCTISIERR